METSDVINLIQNCISNSESKLDSAQILGKSEKFEDAITWIIIAYEEAGKADFLINKLVNKETISDSDWDSLTRGGSHTQKLIMYYENRKKTFEMMSDSDFQTLQNHYQQTFPVNHSKVQVLEELQKTIDFFKKLNNLKKTITYVDKTENEKLSKNELNAIFSLLDFETRKSISLTKFGLETYSYTPTGNDSEDLKELDKFDSFQGMVDLQKESQIPSTAQKFTLAKSLLQNM